MGYRQDFSSATELKDPFFELFCICFMSMAWGIFILSAKNYQDVYWYNWLLYSRIGMSLLGVVLATVIASNKLYIYNISSWYLLLSVGVQASHGFLEGQDSVDFYNFIGIIFVLSCMSYSGPLKDWFSRYLPFHIVFFIGPLLMKNPGFFQSTSIFIDKFSLMVSGLIIGSAILKISSSRYSFIIKYLESRQELVNMAYQVAHDIRSPVETLKVILEGNEIRDREELNIAVQAAQRIDDIASNLLVVNSPRKEMVSSNDFYAVKETVIEALNEKIIESKRFDRITFSVKSSLNGDEICFFNKSDFKAIISNLLNNAIDAITGSGSIEVHLDKKDMKILVKIIDNGHGIPETIKEKLFVKGATYNKTKGSGLGLYFARKKLNEWNSEISLISQHNVGTEVKINLPLANNLRVLIDDDKIISAGWRLRASRVGTELRVFSSVDEFLSKKSEVPKNAVIYIDSELGPNLRGENESRKIYEHGYKSIFLTTGHTDIEIGNYPWIKGVFNKNPPF